MVKDKASTMIRVLVVGNYCHDILFRDGAVMAETIGGSASFISSILDAFSIPSHIVSKVGSDFTYSVSHPPILSSTFSPTTVFHAFFSEVLHAEKGRADRILKCARRCDPITPSDLPQSRFDFGMAVGVGGEIAPETLERILDLCDVVFVDVQSLIRSFDPIDGTVNLIRLEDSGFIDLLPRIGFLKASADEVRYIDVEEARKMCCVVVTNGSNGCKVYSKEELQIPAFESDEVDPTGAGDSFLGGFAYGILQGMAVCDAALLGNLFGSITVSQIGMPKFNATFLLRVKDDVRKRRQECNESRDDYSMNIMKKLGGHEEFHASLSHYCTQSVLP